MTQDEEQIAAAERLESSRMYRNVSVWITLAWIVGGGLVLIALKFLGHSVKDLEFSRGIWKEAAGWIITILGLLLANHRARSYTMGTTMGFIPRGNGQPPARPIGPGVPAK